MSTKQPSPSRVPAYNLQMVEWFAQLAGFSIVPGTLKVRLPRALERGPQRARR